MRIFVALAVLSAAIPAAMADDKNSLTIGAGALFKPEYSGADDYDTTPIPIISAKKEITPGNVVYLKGLTAGLDHQLTEQLTVGAMARYRFERDSSDSDNLAGMPDLDGAVEFGPKVRYQVNRQLGVEGSVLFDVSDAHDGYVAKLGTDYTLPLGQVTYLTLDGSINYGSEDFNNTYYGVTAAQAAPGRPAYTPEGGLTSFEAGATVRHAFSNHWSVQGRLGAEYLTADVADSPLVEQELQPSLMLGVAYTF